MHARRRKQKRKNLMENAVPPGIHVEYSREKKKKKREGGKSAAEKPALFWV